MGNATRYAAALERSLTHLGRRLRAARRPRDGSMPDFPIVSLQGWHPRSAPLISSTAGLPERRTGRDQQAAVVVDCPNDDYPVVSGVLFS